MADLASANGLAVAGSLLLLSGAVVLGRTAFVSLNSQSGLRTDLSVATDKVGAGFGLILLCAGLFVQTCSLLNGGGGMTPLIACFMLPVRMKITLTASPMPTPLSRSVNMTAPTVTTKEVRRIEAEGV